MEETTVQKVLFETRRHSSRPFVSNYPPQSHSKANEPIKKSLFSFFSTRGVSQLKEKLTEYNQQRRLRKLVSLFVSRRAERIAVASGNQITILRKEDDYHEPFGIFTGGSFTTFNIGTWSENHDILSVADNNDTLYFIKANGEVIREITSRHWKVSSPIVGLIAENDSDTQKTCLCSFTVVKSDGSLQNIEISYEPSTSVIDNIWTFRGKFSSEIFLFDYNSELSLFVVVGGSSSGLLTSSSNAGSCYLSLWLRNATMELKQLFSMQFESVFIKPKGYTGQLTYSKVQMSPEGTYIAILDVTGCLSIFKLDKKSFSLLFIASGKRFDSQVTNNLQIGRDLLNCVVDFNWWVDHIIVIVKRTGLLTMLDFRNGLKVQENDLNFFIPALERAPQVEGDIFLLESTIENAPSKVATAVSHHVQWVTEDGFNQFDISRLKWSLISFSQRSISQMYDILISNKDYNAAVEFADCHGLDKDEVVKSQWLQSSHGMNEVNMFLSNVKDRAFVLSECVDRVGPTEDAVKALLAYGLRITDQGHFSEVEDNRYDISWDIRLGRLKLLQFRDRLETYLGINMGRFSAQEYCKFRVMPLNEAAVSLAESGKIGALNLLFKRHPYSLAPFMLEIMSAIPETAPVQTYGQLLPGRSPPTNIAVRENDWVECEEMAVYINGLPQDNGISMHISTEPILKRLLGSFWPSVLEISNWYMDRARAIDSFSGQLDNCLSLLDFAIRKGISELQQFHEDVLYLCQIIYSDDCNEEKTLSLVMWEQLSDYEKFKAILKGAKEECVISKLRDKAIPFMRNRFADNRNKEESFLVRWLKEIALEHRLDICLVIIEEGCKDIETNSYFKDEFEAVDSALQCIYSCSDTDKWSTMAAILSKLPQLQDGDTSNESIKRRVRAADGHIEAGRLLAFYQVPKPVKFFLEAHSDGKGVKQILRLILSKFIRRQSGQPDSEWANLWRDMQCLREKAFPFVEPEYVLTEFCRGLLKAGKFSLARNYLRGTSSVVLSSDKAETLVIQAAREYFFSASRLTCPEIWKAKECLNLYPSSGNVKLEANIIEALTVRLPNLGVTLLPMQFKQIKNPMEIVKMAITSQTGAYLHVDELVEVAKLLGLSSPDDISAVEEAIAREAAVAGDLQLAFDLCLVLTKKGHGLVWDLCAAIARGPALENMDTHSRKQLLGFALSHCDEESVGELLHAWKDLDMQDQCETLMMSTGTSSPRFSVQGSSVILHPVQSILDLLNLKGPFEMHEQVNGNDEEMHLNKIKNILSIVAKSLPIDNGQDWESVLTENGKVLSFAALQLPWLLELRKSAEFEKFAFGKKHVIIKIQPVVTILSWLARNGFAPRDDLIASLAKSSMDAPVSEEEDIMACSYLLNLVNAVYGVEVIEEQLKTRQDYQEVCIIMKVGMTYSLLHDSGVGTENPTQRRNLLQRRFKEKHVPPSSDELDKIDQVQSTFWSEWKTKLEERKRIADQSRALEKIIPGVETDRFLSGDLKYIKSVVLSLIESVKLEKKHVLKGLLTLADTYGLNRTEVLLQYLSAILVSDMWSNDDITNEVSGFKGEIVSHAADTIRTISTIVYPEISGWNKLRLSYIYGLLAECYLQLEDKKEPSPILYPDWSRISSAGVFHYYRVLEQECRNVAFIGNLNFKNIACLDGPNLECFTDEVYNCIDENSLEVLVKMVKVMGSIYSSSVVPKGLITWQDVYKQYVLSWLRALETKARTDFGSRMPENLLGYISNLEHCYDICSSYIRKLGSSDALYLVKQFFISVMPLCSLYGSIPDDSAWQDCLIILINFWMRLVDEVKEMTLDVDTSENFRFNPECLMSCLKIFMRLVMEDIVSPSQGWGTVSGFLHHGLMSDSACNIYIFCRAMVFSGCGFASIAEVFSELSSGYPTGSSSDINGSIQDLSGFYVDVLEPVLHELVDKSSGHQHLYHLLSSLSKLEGDVELLRSVRIVVWEQMVKFSDNLELPSSVRVYVLELMQFISSRSIKGFSAEIQANVLPWEGWDELQYSSKKSETYIEKGLPDHNNSPSRFTNTLVALRSTQLVASISPGTEISPDDLSNLERAVSCFLNLCKNANTDLHVNTLLSILEEWEGLFTTCKAEETSAVGSDSLNDWNDDNWDEGWESLHEEVESLEKDKKEGNNSVHHLHVCWMEIFKKLLNLSRFSDMLSLIDQSLTKPNGILLDEDNANVLGQIVLEMDCFLALKFALSLPYRCLQLQCLGALEDRLKQRGISETMCRDHEFFVLVLSSGVLATILTDSTYGSIFSYICYLVGNSSRRCQELLLTRLTQKEMNNVEDNEIDLHLFRMVLLPHFISELVNKDQQFLAGFLVTKFMHVNPSSSLLNIAEPGLRTYLERHLNLLQSSECTLEKICKTLKNSVLSLRDNLQDLIRSTLSRLYKNSR